MNNIIDKLISYGVFVMLIGCSPYNKLVDAQYNYSGQFSEYQTFGFLNTAIGIAEYDQSIIQSLIFRRFTSMGYTYDGIQPDLLIGIRFFEEGASLVTASQGDLHGWLNTGTVSKDKYFPKRRVNPNGTLIVNFVDLEQGEIIFQALYEDYQHELPDYKIISSVSRMLDKYTVTSY